MASMVKPRPVEEVRALVRERSPLSQEETEALLVKRFGAVPRRLSFALARRPLATARVLDVGCSYGHCLIHFGPGSLGVDNVPEHVEFCGALGLDAVLADADAGLDAVPDGAFDYAWVSDIVEHLDAPRLVLRRIAPKLAPGGRLLLFVTALPRARLVRAALRRRGFAPFDAQAHHLQFTYETARYLIERSGYRIEAVEAPPLPGALGRLARRQAPRLFFAAVRDAELERRAAEAERRNKPAEPGSTDPRGPDGPPVAPRPFPGRAPAAGGGLHPAGPLRVPAPCPGISPGLRHGNAPETSRRAPGEHADRWIQAE